MCSIKKYKRGVANGKKEKESKEEEIKDVLKPAGIIVRETKPKTQKPTKKKQKKTEEMQIKLKNASSC